MHPDVRRPGRSGIVEDVLVTSGLYGFALPAPLFDLLRRYPDFFVANRVETVELFALPLVFTIVLPLAIVLPSVLLVTVAPLAISIFHGALRCVLAALVFLPLLGRLGIENTVLILGTSSVMGLVVALCVHAFPIVRQLAAFSSASLVIVPLVFILSSGIRPLIFAGVAPAVHFTSSHMSDVPVVVVVFDEVNLKVLLDEHEEIDAALFPNFARLADGSHWFRNATTVADGTAHAVPAILSGRRIERRRTAAVHDNYVQNLFTLLARSHDIIAHESASALCPPGVCRPIERPRTWNERMNILAVDLALIYGHAILPPRLSGSLPDVSQGWGDFLAEAGAPEEIQSPKVFGGDWIAWVKAEASRDRVSLFDSLLNAIEPGGQPGLYFMHILLPHSPMVYLPDGKRYVAQTFGSRKGRWMGDAWAVDQAFQRHLFHLVLVDSMLGSLLEKLEQQGIYDETLLIVTADHGVSYRVNDSKRAISGTNYGDILPVPLFVKQPGQRVGQVSDRNVETIDILPTVADVLGIPLEEPIQGVSVFDAGPQRAGKRLISYQGEVLFHDYPARLDRDDEMMRRMRHLFGAPGRARNLFAIGQHRTLVGQPTGPLLVEEMSEIEINCGIPTGTPTVISGSLPPTPDRPDVVHLALSMNGRIGGVTRTFAPEDDGSLPFIFIVPADAYGPFGNDTSLYIIEEDARGRARLVRPTVL